MLYKKILQTFAKLGLLILILNVLWVCCASFSLENGEIFSDGFESGNFSAWTGTNGSPSIVKSPVHHGSYAAQADAAYEYWYKTFSGQTVVYVRFYFRLSALIYFEIFKVRTSTANIGTLNIDTDGSIRYIYKNGAADQYLPSYSGYPAKLRTNTWYCLEIKHTINGTNGEVAFWLNGTLCASANGKDTDNYGNITEILLGRYYGSGTCIATFDCVVVANAYIGPEEVTQYQVSLSSAQNDEQTTNKGKIKVDAMEYTLPYTVTLSTDQHTIQYLPEFGYEFEKWDTTGNVSVASSAANPTTLKVNGTGTLKAVYKAATPKPYKISVNSQQHKDYGLSYPVTYVFQIPEGSSNLKAYYRYSLSEDWSQLTEKTPNDFFNGIQCVRFNYTGNIAYVSVAFSSTSDDIYVKITDNANATQLIQFLCISKFYDNRRAAVYAQLEDYIGYSSDLTIIDMFQERNIWLTLSIITNSVISWSTLQNEVNEGFVECASHSRTHPNVLPYSNYDSEIGGSKGDVIGNLTLPTVYDNKVWAYIEPAGLSDGTVRQKLYQYRYLVARSTYPYYFDYVNWNSSEQLFERAGPSISGDSATISELNAAFDYCYQNQGVYGFYFHPGIDLNKLRAHLDYIKNKSDVWYVGFGALYAYRYLATVANIYIGPETSENNAPTISSFEAPNIAYANKYFLLSATINDADGIKDFVNATVEISNNIILKWDSATDVFSVHYDPNNYCILDASGCSREQLSSTAYKLSWKIKIGWTYPEGYVSVLSTNTKVYDLTGYYGSRSQSNLFYFEDDLIVYSATVDDSRINPSQTITFSGTLYYQGTTNPPEDTSGITAKIELNGALKGSTTTIGMDGAFSIKVQGEPNIGLFSYVLFAFTDENTVQNQTVDVIIDRIAITGGGTTKEVLVLGETATIWFRAAYEYDGSTFTGANGSLYTNGLQMNWSQTNTRWECIYQADAVGLMNFAVSEVYDASQGLTTINDAAGTQTITVWSTPFTIISNSTVTELTFDSATKTIGFTVTGLDGTTGSTNVTISKELIQEIGGLQIYIDGNTTSYTVTSNNYYWLVHFTYTHSTHKVLIILNQAIINQTSTNLGLANMLYLTEIVAPCIAILLAFRKIRKNTKWQTLLEKFRN